ncbi:MAG: family intrarane metalloprotease [Chitinophagaceae bacterium]|nr:family intrarane metalloprotease [Chitinophagaceae bacterium]MDB5221894.1 family intrarane metalloprotease [Chitinophagaceae bacterium]
MILEHNSKNVKYPSQLAILLGLTGGGLVIGSLATFAIWTMMTGESFPLKAEDILQPKYYKVNMVLQAVSTFLIFFVPVHFFAAICYRKPFTYLGFNFRVNYKQVLLLIGILILTFPLSGALAELNKIIPISESWAAKFKAMELAREAQEAALININSFSRYIISLIVIALLPAIFEETFFRGGLQNLLTRWFKGPWVAIIFTGIIFSIIHLSFYGFLVRFALGVVLGFIFYYSGSLWLNILFHFLFNGIQVTALYIMTMNGVKNKNIEENFPLWAGAIALLLLLYLFKLFKQTSALKQSQYVEEITPDDEFQNWTANNS